MEVVVDHHLHDEGDVRLVWLQHAPAHQTPAEHHRARARHARRVVQAHLREQTLPRREPVKRLRANEGHVVDEPPPRRRTPRSRNPRVRRRNGFGEGPGMRDPRRVRVWVRVASVRGGVRARPQRLVQIPREIPNPRARLRGFAREVVVVGDVKVRERAVEMEAPFLPAGCLAEDAHDRYLRALARRVRVVRGRGSEKNSIAWGVPTFPRSLALAHLVHGGAAEESGHGRVQPGRRLGEVIVDRDETEREHILRPFRGTARGLRRHLEARRGFVDAPFTATATCCAPETHARVTASARTSRENFPRVKTRTWRRASAKGGVAR